MLTLRVDTAKNRIYITLAGFVGLEEMQEYTGQVVEATKQLKPGYDVITDISQFKPTTAEATKEIERVQAHFKASGVRRGIRVVGESAIASLQFSRTSKQVGYVSNTVATLAEAEKLLDGE